MLRGSCLERKPASWMVLKVFLQAIFFPRNAHLGALCIAGSLWEGQEQIPYGGSHIVA